MTRIRIQFPMSRTELLPFDPQAEFSVVERRLPHWSQAGAVAFITWRTWDSMPRVVVDRWIAERENWLRDHGIDPESDWKPLIDRLPPEQQRELQRIMAERWDQELDHCHGRCVLRDPQAARIVGESLRHFDGDRYSMSDFVVMPNHVHVLASFCDHDGMLKQCDSWKHYTAVRLNKLVGRRGRFWEVDAFDRLVRDADEFEHYRRYIADNPRRARLRPGEYLHYARS